MTKFLKMMKYAGKACKITYISHSAVNLYLCRAAGCSIVVLCTKESPGNKGHYAS
jgi:hypothetical protein